MKVEQDTEEEWSEGKPADLMFVKLDPDLWFGSGNIYIHV